MKNVVLLGSTGSIGTSTVKVAEDLPDQIRLIGLAAGGNADFLNHEATTLGAHSSVQAAGATTAVRVALVMMKFAVL